MSIRFSRIGYFLSLICGICISYPSEAAKDSKRRNIDNSLIRNAQENPSPKKRKPVRRTKAPVAEEEELTESIPHKERPIAVARKRNFQNTASHKGGRGEQKVKESEPL